MPVVFYIAGIVFGLVCANFTYAAVAYTEPVTSALQVLNFQMAQASSVGIAVASGIMSAVFFSTGAIIETLRHREAE